MLEVINRYKHGYVIIPVIRAFEEKGLFNYFQKNKTNTSQHISKAFGANSGHLQVALRIMESLGWVNRNDRDEYSLAEKAKERHDIPTDILALYEFDMESYVQGKGEHSLKEWIKKSCQNWSTANKFIVDLLDGILVISLLLALKKYDLLALVENNKKVTLDISKLANNVSQEILVLFAKKGWTGKNYQTVIVTNIGRFIFERIFIAATVASYKPMLSHLPDLLFGNQEKVFQRDEAGHEKHIDRTLNVVGSGFQHVKYFREIETLIISIYDQPSFEEQPKYIADMGCGNGLLLKRIYETIRDKTIRGSVLEEYPVTLIGVDFNEKALLETSRTLGSINHLSLKGDIGDPQQMIKDLQALGINDPENILHVRSFLDHDRPFIAPQDNVAIRERSKHIYRGVYVDEEGQSISSEIMIQSLVEHLKRWSSIKLKYGLVVLEVHNLAPKVTGSFLDKSENLYFDAYHGFSKQYLVEAEAFLICAAEAGFYPKLKYCRKYPKTLPFSRITLNYFEKKAYTIRHPQQKDIPALLDLNKLNRSEGINKGVINNLIMADQSGQYVLVLKDKIIAAAYSQLNTLDNSPANSSSYTSANQAAFEIQHNSEPARELIDINLSPDSEFELGSELLDFVEYHCHLSSVAKLKGVSKCRLILTMYELANSTKSIDEQLNEYVANYPIASSEDTILAEQELEKFGTRWLLTIFHEMGLSLDDRSEYSIERLKLQLNILPKYYRLFDALLIMLETREMVSVQGKRLKIQSSAARQRLTNPEEDRKIFKAAFTDKYPFFVSFMNLMERGLGRYSEVITGQLSANEAIFPGGTMDTFEAIFKGDKVSDYFNDVLAEIILRKAVSCLGKSNHDKVRVLEIGAGTGGATAIVLEKLKDCLSEVEFTYTDISYSFVRYGKRKFSHQYPELKYDVLNIEEKESVEKWQAGSFDIVYASNVLHDTKFINYTLSQVKRLLKEDGLLALNEFTRMKDLLLFTGGLLHGWWLFEDIENRLPHSCLLSVGKWKTALENSGFEAFNSYTLPFIKDSVKAGQAIITAESQEIKKLPEVNELQEIKESQVEGAVPVTTLQNSNSLGNIDVNTEFERLGEDLSFIIEKVKASIRTILDDRRMALFSPTKALEELGLDSMESLELQFELESSFDVKLEPMFLFQYETMEAIVNYFVEVLPKTYSSSASSVLGDTNNASVSTQIERESINSKVESSIRTILGDARMDLLTPTTVLTEIGLDSMESLELQAALENSFDVKLAPEFVFQYETMEAIENYFVSMLMAVTQGPTTSDPVDEVAGFVSPKEGNDNLVKKVESSIRIIMGDERMESLAATTALSEAGLDSMENLELQSALESSFGVKLEPTFLYQYETMEAIANYFIGTLSAITQKPSASVSVNTIEDSGSPQEKSSIINEKVEASIRAILDDRRLNDFIPTIALTELGLDSMESLELQSALESSFNVKLAPEFLFQYETMDAIVNYFNKKLPNLKQTPIERKNQTTYKLGKLNLKEKERSATIGDPLVNIGKNIPSLNAFRPLSYNQEGMWAMHQMDRGRLAHNVPLTIVLRGYVDVAALSYSVKQLMSRHEVLRSHFVETNSHVEYELREVPDIDMDVIDLTSCSSQQRTNLFQELTEKESGTPFDLSTDLPFRTKLLKINDKRHIFLVTMHHLVCDGWSIRILFDDLSVLYNANISGKNNPLEPLAYQYSDYTQWQKALFDSGQIDKQLHFWRDALEGASPILNLPTDRARPGLQDYSSELYEFTIPKIVAEDLRLLSTENNCTLYITLLSAFNLLLHRYSDQSDIIIGSLSANRDAARFRNLIGYFTNILVMRTQFGRPITFAELLSNITDYNKLAQINKDVPFVKLIEQLQIDRGLNYSPLVQVLFAFQNIPVATNNLLKSHFSIIEIVTKESQFDLKLEIQDVSGELKAKFEYSKALFDKRTIERFSNHLLTLLEEIVLDPGQLVSHYNFLSEAEKQQQLSEWNDTNQRYPQNQSIHSLFESQVEASPEAIALVYENQHLSYTELNHSSNRLAHYLLSQGVGPEVRVGICVERSMEMVTGLLGILKAGGCYVALDPAFPAQRLQYLIEDSGVRLIVTESAIQNCFALDEQPDSEKNIQFVLLDSDWERLSYGIHNPLASLHSSNLAYVIYTSGSTGKPKGVGIQHKGAVSLLNWSASQLSVKGRRGILASTSICFDLSIYELFLPLSYGGECLVIDSILSLGHMPQRDRVSLINTVPSAAKALLEKGAIAQSLSTMNLAGEPLKADLVDDLYESTNVKHIYDLYGPSEGTTYSTYTKRELKGRETIGRPVANTEVYILDRHGQLVTVGIVGELYLGGVGLSRGYINRASLTAKQFVPHPFSQVPGERLYRTGDLVRYLPDGNIEFIGRIDHQIKVRGFRIELGEIETKLLEHPLIQSCVVHVREDNPGDTRIVAYAVVNKRIADKASIEPGNQNHASTIRTHLQYSLPEYMIPTAFVMLDVLPLTANGKVDRKALPIPEQEACALESYVAPMTETENILVTIWADLLGFEADKISSTANFFALGGHSLLEVQMIARLQSQGLLFDFRGVSNKVTLGELAAIIDTSMANTWVPFEAAPNLIPDDCAQITPEMLPLVKLTAAEIAEVTARVPGGSRNIQDIYPLAPMQEGILFHHQMDRANDPYVLTKMYFIDSRAQLEAYIDALQSVIDRHDVLRTAILTEGLPTPVQVVYRQATLPVEEIKLDPDIVIQEQMKKLLAEGQGMELSLAPLLRLQIAPDPHSARWIVLIRYYHIIIDHVGFEIVESEVTAYLKGQATQLKPTVPYRDFIAHTLHQNKTLDAETFFTQRLGDISEPTMPFNLQDVHGDGSQIVHLQKSLPTELAVRIRNTASDLQISPATLFHAAWAVVVGRCSGRDDVVFGTVLSGRLQGLRGVDHILGMFINTLPLRTSIQCGSVHQLIVSTDEALHELLVFEQASLVLANSCSGLASGSPLFSAILNYRHSSPEESNNELDCNDPVSYDSGITFIGVQERNNYPFTIAVDDWGRDKGFSLDAKIARPVSAERVIDYLETCVCRIVESLEVAPDSPVSSLSILPQRERQQLLLKWNNTTQAYPQDKCIHKVFEEQVEKSTESIALVFEDRQMSYGELNRQSNRLAHYLVAQGVGPEVLVGICVERSLDMMIGLFGILKAGGAYVPLDPSYPAARLNYMLNDSKLTHLLTQVSLCNELELSEQTQVTELNCRKTLQQIKSYPVTNLKYSSNHSPANLAYVIYTSGSTGKPKGTQVTHQGLSNYNDHVVKRYLREDIVGAVVSNTLSFDATVTALFPPLLMGKQVEVLRDSDELLSLLNERLFNSQVPLLFKLTPSHLVALEEIKPASIDSNIPHVIVFGGESSSLSVLQKWKGSLLTNATFVHHYGPTETVVGSSDFIVANKEILASIPGTSTPIGKPIQNTCLYVLDDKAQLKPVNSVGELYIGGAGLARGYLNQPGLTAERFIQNPFSEDPNERLYKTGDLVRWLPDGNLEFIGRVDSQVKIHGFRIELGEIEHHISQCESVKSSMVVVQEVDLEHKRLVVYVLQKDEKSDSENELLGQLKHILQTRLPDYMVPSVFVFLDKWPLMPNGKIDKKALPLPAESDLQKDEYVAPRNKLEKTLCQIWQDILKLDKVGIHDNFFAMGGQSLLAMRLVSSIRQEFEVEVELRLLFKSPTIAQLSKSFMIRGNEFVLPPVLPADRNKVLPLSYAQQRLWFIDQFGEGSVQYNVPSNFQLQGKFNKSAFKQALNVLLERHEVLRTHFKMVEGEARQVIIKDYDLPFAWHDLSQLNDKEKKHQVQQRMQEEADAPFNLSNDLMLRVRVLKLSNTEHLILYTMHHIASDGWSRGILQNELSVLYEAFSKKQANSLKQLQVQYADYAVWQRDWLRGEVLEKQLSYWQAQLAGTPVVHNLPLDKLRPTHQTFEGIIKHHRFNKATTEKIRALCETHEVTTFMFLQTAFAILLGRYSNETDIVMGAPIAGRTHTDIEALIGFFVNTLVLRTNLSNNSTFSELLKENKDVMLDAYAYQHIPFEMLVEELQPERHLGHNPIFQIVIAGQNNELGMIDQETRRSSLSSGGEIQERQILPFTTKMNTRFDLELHVYELGEELSVSWVYNVALFERESINRLAINYGVLLDSIIESLSKAPEEEKKIDSLELLGKEEKQAVLVNWNETQADYPRSTHVAQLTKQQMQESLETDDRPLSNSSLYVLDSELRLVPIGVVGDLYISGLNFTADNTSPTGESKSTQPIINPFTDNPENYLFKTGDLARWLTDGSLVFPCNDEQVKSTEYKVKLTEVGCILAQHPLLSNSVLLARDYGKAGRKVVAYVVEADKKRSDTDPAIPLSTVLRQYIRSQPQMYPLPELLMELDELPLSSEGKPEFIGRLGNQVVIDGFNIDLGEIETVLRTHKSLAEVVITTQGLNSDVIVAHICPSGRHLDNTAEKFIEEHIDHWSSFYDDTYDKAERDLENDLNLSGWSSSYTDEPIAVDQMQEWLTNTMRCIERLQPKHLLEIGCGTGLLLFRYGAFCESVHAMDISSVALSGIQQELDNRGWDHIDLQQGDALSVSTLSGKIFDTVVINSVVPYLPGRLYLERMLERLLPCVKDGGKILIGDVRNLDLHAGHVVEVEKSRLTKRISMKEFSRRVGWRIQQEQELLISPSFFAQLPDRFPEIKQVDIAVKRGIGDNEMARYRYEVELTVEKQSTPVEKAEPFPWIEFNTLESVRGLLDGKKFNTFGIFGVTNDRVSENFLITEQLHQRKENQFIDPGETPGRLSKKSLEQIKLLEELLQYAEQCGYNCRATWSQDSLDKLDIIFSSGELPAVQARSPYIRDYLINYPKLATMGLELSIELKQHLQRCLPDYMLPSVYITMEQLPLTSSGQVDKKALPIPKQDDLEKEDYAAPRNEFEKTLCQLWQDVLKLDKVGIHDNFFVLGGHSLLATRLASLIRQKFNAELQVRVLFESPTVAELSECLKTQSDDFILPPVIPADRDKVLPLSYAQQRLWFIDQLGEGSAEYNAPGRFLLQGEFKVAAFKRALKALLDRHEVLRTHFITVDGEARQVIVRNYTLPFMQHNLLKLNEANKSSQVQQLIQEEVETPFNLSKDLMLRVRLVKLSASSHLILYTMHHIASDGWSMGILHNELSTLYEAFKNKQPNPLVPLKVQYADYAQWQKNWLQGEVLEKQLGYWQKQLAGIPAIHNLQLDKPRPAQQTFDGMVFHQRFSKATSEKIRALCEAQEVTVFMFLQTAFSVLLGRYSNATDIVMGSPIAGRTHTDIEALIGFFVNTLVLRTDLSGKPTFSELLKTNKGVILDAYANQHIPFEMLVDELHPERHLSHNPIFQIMFVGQNYERSVLELQGQDHNHDVEKEFLSSIDKISIRFDLELNMNESEDELSVRWVYNVALFEKETISRMTKNYGILVNSIIDNLSSGVKEERCIDSLEMLGEEEKQTVLVDWNKTQSDYPKTQNGYSKTKCIPPLFEKQVEKTPEAIALMCDSQRLNYAELNSRSNQLAHYLIEQGVGPEIPVGLCVERSIEMVIGILGILKAGGCYVPLYPENPRPRLTYLIEDSGVELILTQSAIQLSLGLTDIIDGLYESSKTGRKFQCLALDENHIGTNFGTSNPLRPLHHSNLAYVIYTSGSTGKPKGVSIAHQALINRIDWMQRRYSLTGDDSVLQKTPFSFDVSVWEFIWPLVCGARLVMAKPGGHKDPLYLAKIIQQENISVLHFVPPMLNAFLQSTNWAECHSVRQVICSGEALSKGLQARFFAAQTGSELDNLYGPTEAAIDVSFWNCTDESIYSSVPIGKPIQNIVLYVVDDLIQPVPIGGVGELLIGGVGLSRGYVKKALLTAEKFIPNPFSGAAGERLYRTGDLVRYLPDGNLDFIGRIDHQVKLRGFRIELGEIENVLLQHHQVKNVVVLVREDEPQTKRLVAYVVGKETSLEKNNQTSRQHDVFIDQLITHVQSQLPAYMVPGTIVILEELPLTANGKLDRGALPAPDLSNQQTGYIPPTTEIEQILCEVWQEMLGVEQIGTGDNFFTVGGDSILSIQMVSRAKSNGLGLTVRDLFKHPTIRELARQVNSLEKTAQDQFIAQSASTGLMDLLPIHRWFYSNQASKPQHFNLSRILTVPKDFSLEFLRAFVAALYNRQDGLRLRYKENNGQWQGWFEPQGEQMLEQTVVQESLRGITKASRQRKLATIGESIKAGFDLASGPLFKSVYFKASRFEDSRLLLVLHHLVMDGVSWRILLNDLTQAFEQWRAGESISLAPKTTSYQQWAKVLLDYRRSDALQAEKAYWVSQLSASVPELPVDHRLSGTDTYGESARIIVGLNQTETHALLNRCGSAYRTRIQELLLVGLVLAFHGWTGQRGLRIDLEGHGREEGLFEGPGLSEADSSALDLSETIGWFTSLYPVTLQLPEQKAEGQGLLAGVIKEVKEQLRSIPRQGLGYGVLRYLSQDETLKQLEQTNRASVLFNYLGQFDQQLGEDALFSPTADYAGRDIDEMRPRDHWLGLSGSVRGGSLQFALDYSPQRHSRETIENLGQQYTDCLRALISHCQQPSAGAYTPSDFPLVQLEQSTLDSWQASYPQLEDLYPATGMQLGLMFHSLLDEAGEAYATQIHLDFEGNFQPGIFQQAWAQMMSRHAIFRTAFIGNEKEQPLQMVLKAVSLEWYEKDWRDLNATEQASSFELYRQNDKARGFDFSQAPLMRMTLMRLSDTHYRWLWTHHHSLLDGWSVAVVLGELFNSYGALKTEGKISLPAVTPYRDFATWLSRREIALAEAFWRQELAGVEAPAPLGIDHLPVDPETPGQQKRTLLIDDVRTELLTAQAQRYGVTLNTVIQAAWSYLLYRYSGESSIIFGQTVSGRTVDVAGIDQMVGLFINTLPVRVEIERDGMIGDWLQLLQQGQVERENYGYVPLVEIQRVSEIPARQRLFNTLLVFENYPIGAELKEASAGGKTGLGFDITDVGSDEGTGYGLTLVVVPGQELVITLRYLGQSYSGEIAERLLGHLDIILGGFMEPEIKHVRALPYLSDSERKQLLVELNATETDYLRDKCIHTLFEEQAENSPEAIALVYEGQQLSYGELNRRSNQLAHYLKAQGVGPEVRVGLCIERSLGMVVGILGVLKAGGCYVPMDPEYPEARLVYMFEQSACRIILHGKRLFGAPLFLSAEKIGTQVKDLGELILGKYSNENIGYSDTGLSPGNLAYVIYTSGSTGEPKGVSITHQSLNNLATFQSKQYQLDHNSRLLQFASLSFDAATWDWSMALISGSVLHLIPEETVKSVDRLNLLVKSHCISYSYIPPALLSMLNLSDFKSMTTLTVGGESPSLEIVNNWLADRRLYNAYGPTENTVVATTSQIKDSVGLLPIGKPIENVTSYVLSVDREIVPLGVVGELYLGGDGLSRGYLNLASFTAENFIPHPFSQTPGERLYRTGDLVRYLLNGELEFVGRIDQQVKVRGLRIEMGEIENVLLQHEQVKDVVALARDDGQDSKRLVAYVVVAGSGNEGLVQSNDFTDLISKLRTHTQKQLPAYMAPSAIVVLESLPLTTNGKVDREALPIPDLSIQQIGYVVPEGETEELLSSLWIDILKCDRVGRLDNFFDLGGHSLSAMQLVSRIREAFSVELAIQALFEQQSLQDQAEAIEDAQKEAGIGIIASDNIIKKFQNNKILLNDLEGNLEKGEI